MHDMLTTVPNLPQPDAAYARILEAHQGLSIEESVALNARLVLILVNHVGDMQVLAEAIDLARNTSPKSPKP
jgi:hypothetical protein